MTATYASLDEAKSEQKANSAVDDAKFMRSIRAASARIDLLMHSRRPFFMPWIEQREFVVRQGAINSAQGLFYFDDNLLSMSAVGIGSATPVIGTDVDLWTPLASPAHALRLLQTGSNWYDYCTSSSTPQPNRLLITGIWGFHRDYANAWLSVDTLQAAIVTAGATTLTVEDVDGLDPYNRTPRISVGNLIRIDSEFMEVVAVNTTTNVVTVRRAANGSTAAAHNNGTGVDVWQVEEEIKYATARFAGFLYARQGAYESFNVNDLGAVQFPSDLLGVVKGVVAAYAYD